MKKNKLFIAAIAMFCLLVFAFTGCNNDKPNVTDNNGQDDAVYYTVSFDSMGGSSVESQRILEGNTARVPDVPTRESYSFTGWYKSAADNADAWAFTTDRVNSDITLYAKWQANETITPTQSLTFTRNGDGYTVTGASGQEEKIIIPAEHENLPVTEIGESAFAYSKHKSDITYVSIPDTVKTIGLNAFHNRSELAVVDISGNSALTQIGNNAFSGNGALKSIYIPQGVTAIGDGAFNNCGSLNNISVAVTNTAFSDEGNNLIEKATNTLIRGSNNSKIPDAVTKIAPAAFRRANSITALYIPLSVVEIGNYFIADSTIEKINYAGTEEQWNAIEKSATMWNFGNKDVVVAFSVGVGGSSVLVIYFSRAGENWQVGTVEKGNTEIIVDYITAEYGFDTFKIDPTTPYPTDYTEMVNLSREEQSSNARPAYNGVIANFDSYSDIILGYPIWNGTFPNIVLSLLDDYDFSGKTIYPFSTHGGSGLGNTLSVLAREEPNATIGISFSISGASVRGSSARTQTIEWINGLGLKKSSEETEAVNMYSDVPVSNIKSLSAEELAVLNTYRAVQQAMIDKDRATLERYYSEDQIFTHMTGKRQTREEFISDIENGELNYYTCTISNVTVTIDGNNATLSCTAILDAKPYNYGRNDWTFHPTVRFTRINNEWMFA